MIGIDEVGRGCWAGPLLVVAARQTDVLPKGLADSKKLTKKQRENLYFDIRLSCDIGEGWVTAIEIDKVGLSAAMKLGVSRALQAVGAAHDEEIVMDGTINYCDIVYTDVICEARADDKFPAVSAASVHAKVTRDAFMAEQDQKFPQYGFGRHVGYGTKEHLLAIHKHGVNELHRISFQPIKGIVSI